MQWIGNVHKYKYTWSQALDAQLVGVPYSCPFQGNVPPPLSVFMVFILPSESHKNSFGEWFSGENFTWTNIASAIRSMELTGVDLTIPKFSIESGSIDLDHILKAMGMKVPFTDEADFSKMLTSKRSIFISEVIHAAKVRCIENSLSMARGY